MELPDVFTPELLKQLELQKISARKSYLGSRQGGHFSLKRGHGIEFSDYRTYEPGDDPRHIDWNLVARSERFYIKRFREEQDLLVHIFIDNSASMFTPDDAKWQRAVELALAISYISSIQHDRVQLALPGIIQGKKYSGKSIIYSLYQDLKNITTPQTGNFFESLSTCIAAANFPGVAYVISDFLSEQKEIKEILTQLMGKNLDITAIQVLGEEDIKPNLAAQSIAQDSESNETYDLELNHNSEKEYEQLLKQHNRELSDFCYTRQIAFCACTTLEPFKDFAKYL